MREIIKTSRFLNKIRFLTFYIAAGLGTSFVHAELLEVATTNVHAQQAEETADTSLLEEILVTARRREESLQDTPVSITAFTGETLAQLHIDRLNGIASATPNLIFDSGATFSGANSSASVFIRGIGQVDFTLTTEPGVGIYLDGVYLSQTIGSVLDLVDIERVEVL
ncbi:MAG: Plug domain-containing protein, partial [Pseudomonadales bacterium]|nr:Plug domain-containing protein [Pseudomonadales bacterium]